MNLGIAALQPLYQLIAWCNGYRWEAPWRELRPPDEVIARALALRDEGLRRHFRDKDARPQVPTIQVTS
ncbi:hypothetical protein [Knoellia sp. Soil729]|uniref:hypothetical protein n=1 Tax=Knoellia sp. Soil729 TaxID=1736394 RepID=UPI0007019277|nr:hypothetical protein [Knoellia sp. Soil729]KRE42831.1 hypothetical protein ASG74_10705 [Knoellia sp. Soil729]